MASLVFLLARRGSVDPGVSLRGLRAAPHRGERTEVAQLGRAAVGVTNGSGPASATIATAPGWLAAVAGRIDNLEGLAKELLDQGSEVEADVAASVVLGSFLRHGEDAVALLRGVFEGVVTDGTRAWLFRDQFGFRPLFFHDGASSFVAATEAKQVVAAAGLSLEPDLDAVDRILFGDFNDDTPSSLCGVRRLPKSTLLQVDERGVRTRCYWDPRPLLETADPDIDELRERFDALMEQAVGRTLTGQDVLSLSGGLDSPTVAAFAAPAHVRVAGKPLAALSTVYPDQPQVDESVWIEEVASSLEMPLHTYRRSARPLDGLQEWMRLFDGPVPTLVVNDAKEHYDRAVSLGYRTMLTGELAEFLVDQRKFLVSHLLRARRWEALREIHAINRQRGVSALSFAGQLAATFTPSRLEALRIRRRGPAARVGLPAWVDPARVTRAELAQPVAGRDRWAAAQLAALGGPGLTMEADEICQEVSGIMSRRPWADVDLFEFFASLPAETKYQGRRRKDLVRLLMRGRLPDSVLNRPTKTLFNASILARIEYEELRRWLLDPPVRVVGIRYDLLAERLGREDLSLIEYQWAKDLACVQAFLALW